MSIYSSEFEVIFIVSVNFVCKEKIVHQSFLRQLVNTLLTVQTSFVE